jgi:hypothetical protein
MTDRTERIGWRVVAVLFATAIVLKLVAAAWESLHG